MNTGQRKQQVAFFRHDMQMMDRVLEVAVPPLAVFEMTDSGFRYRPTVMEAQESKKQDQQEAIDVAMVSLTLGVSWLQ